MTQNFSANTVEEAKALAARAFDAPIADITFEVLEEPKRGLFGIGRKGTATVRATYESRLDKLAKEQPAAPVIPSPVEYDTVAEDSAEEAVEEAAPVVEEAAPVVEEAAPVVEEATAPIVEEVAPVVEEATAPIVEEVATVVEETTAPAVEEVSTIPAPAVETQAPAQEPAPKAETPAPAAERAPLQLDEELITGEPDETALAKIEKAKAYLMSIFAEMGVEAELVVKAGATSAMIEIVSQNSGTVIGKRGETLDALQYLTFMIANRGDKEYYRIILNSANYRERRRKTLEELANKIAKNVLRSGRQTTLEPMNPYERRIIHSAIAEIEGVASRSVGEEPYRKVIISSTKPVRRGRPGNDRRGGKPGGNRNDRRGNNRNNRNDRGRRNESVPSERISMDSMKTSFEKDYKRPKADDEINAGLYGKIEF